MSFLQDVIVVGAGPAGATLSYLLARSGVRITLLEQQRVLDREFRGPAYQPAVVRLWEEMGILEEILELEVRKFEAFSFFEGGEKLAELNLADLPGPYNYLLLMQQATLLKRLITLCGQYPNFTYLGGSSVTGLVRGGVKTTIGVVEGRLVVGCDGRFSKVRAAAGIELQEAEQSFDVVWFEMPTFEGAEPELGFYATEEGMLLHLPKEGGLLQVGIVLPKGGYSSFKERGLEHFKQQVTSMDPKFAQPLADHLTSWDQCHLLDVKMGMAKEWARDGLLLIGDAAHIASPIGALGNKLAIEDAALAHPIVMEALRSSAPIIPKKALLPLVKQRLPDIRKTLRLQRVMGHTFLKMPFVRRHLLPYMRKTPFWRKVRHTIALSPHPAKVATQYFRDGGRQYQLLKVKEVIHETPQAKTLVFDAPFTGQAGQFITIRLLREGRLLKRCYSVASVPGDALAITVKRVEGGRVSSYLHDEVKVGDKLLCLPPAGEFVATDATSYTFIAGGSGITPIYSLIRSLLPTCHIRLLYVNSSPETTIFREALDRLQQTSSQLSVTHHWTCDLGKPDEGVLRPFLTPSTYLCGPTGLMELAETSFGSELHKESYASATGLQEERLAAVPPTEVGTGPLEDAETVTVTIGESTTTIPCRKGETILGAALAAGLPAPFSCQEGICSTCQASLIKGKVRMDHYDVLTTQDIENRQILTCRACPLTKEVAVHYEKE